MVADVTVASLLYGLRVRSLAGLLLLSLAPALITASEPAPAPPALDLDLLPALPSINDGWPVAVQATDESLDESHARMDRLLGDVVSYVVQERSQQPVHSAVRPSPTQMRAQAESVRPPAEAPVTVDITAGDR